MEGNRSCQLSVHAFYLFIEETVLAKNSFMLFLVVQGRESTMTRIHSCFLKFPRKEAVHDKIPLMLFLQMSKERNRACQEFVHAF
jgi:hypothetical protein